MTTKRQEKSRTPATVYTPFHPCHQPALMTCDAFQTEAARRSVVESMAAKRCAVWTAIRKCAQQHARSAAALAAALMVFSTAAAQGIHVVDNDRMAPVWSIEAIEGTAYLRGVQETRYGTGKMIINCGPKGKAQGATMMSVYTAGDKSALIAKGGWEHSVMVNGELLPLPKPLIIEARGESLNTLFPLEFSTLRQMQYADKVGHAMQLDRTSRAFVGYSIDIDKASRTRFSTYIGNCLP